MRLYDDLSKGIPGLGFTLVCCSDNRGDTRLTARTFSLQYVLI